MSSFHGNLKFEDAFTDRIYPGLVAVMRTHNMTIGRHTMAREKPKSVLVKELQTKFGDFTLYRDSDGKILMHADLKAERRSSKNMFFETHSNCVLDPNYAKAGWGITLNADRIWYAFDDSGVIANIKLDELRAWLGEVVDQRRGTTRLDRMERRQQLQHEQMNRTVGHLVPFTEIPEGIFNSGWQIRPDGSLAEISHQEFCDIVAKADAAAPPRHH